MNKFEEVEFGWVNFKSKLVDFALGWINRKINMYQALYVIFGL